MKKITLAHEELIKDKKLDAGNLPDRIGNKINYLKGQITLIEKIDDADLKKEKEEWIEGYSKEIADSISEHLGKSKVKEAPKKKAKSKPKAKAKKKASKSKSTRPEPAKDIDINRLKGETRGTLIPNKYKMTLPILATQDDRLEFLYELGYVKVSHELLDEINFSKTNPVALTGVGATYGKYKLSKQMHEDNFMLEKI